MGIFPLADADAFPTDSIIRMLPGEAENILHLQLEVLPVQSFTDRLWNRAHGKLINLSPIHLGERIMLCTKLAVKDYSPDGSHNAVPCHRLRLIPAPWKATGFLLH